MLRLADTQSHSQIVQRLKVLEAASGGRPLVVLAGTSINALGVARSLGSEGIKVVWLTSNSNAVAHHSRFASCTIVCDDIFYEGFVPALLRLGPAFTKRPALFLTHDFQVKCVSEAREQLLGYYQFDFPARPVVNDMVSKAGFFRLGSACGLALPATRIIRNSAELADFVKEQGGKDHWVVKPLEKSDPFEEHFGKAIKIEKSEQWLGLAQVYDRLSLPLLVQSWVNGPDQNIAFCLVVFDSESRCVMSFGGKKIRQYKPEVGNTASAEKFFDETVRDQTVRFFSEHQFRGMGSLEFKYNQASRIFEAIEPTVGRTNLK